jgi:hypothetical protein
MLLITIDLLPGGHASHRRTLASMQIANITGLADISDYHIGAIEGANPLTGTPPRSTTCIVTGHDRNQAVWALVAKAASEIMLAEFDEL